MARGGQAGDAGDTHKGEAGFLSLIISASLIYGLNNVSTSAMPSYVLSQGGSDFLSSAQTSMFVGLAVLLRLFFGPLSDRRGPRFVMAAGALGFAVPCALMPLAGELWQVLALRLCQAVGLAAYHPCVAHCVSRICPQDQVGRRMGFVRFASTLSLMVGPALLFPVIDSAGFGVFFEVLAAVGFAGLLLLLPIDDRQRGQAGSAAPTAREATRDLARRRTLDRPQLALLAATFVCALGYSCFLNFGRGLVRDALPGVNDGLVFTFLAAGGLAGSLLCGRMVDARGARGTVAGCLACMAAGAIALSVASSMVGLFVGAAVFGAGYYGATTALTASASRVSDPAARGRFIALQQSSLDIGIVAGSLLAGLIVQLTGGIAGAFVATATVIAAFFPSWLAVFQGNEATRS